MNLLLAVILFCCIFFIAMVSPTLANESVPSLDVGSGCLVSDTPGGNHHICTWYFPDYDTAYRACQDIIVEHFPSYVENAEPWVYCGTPGIIIDDQFHRVHAGNFHTSPSFHYLHLWYPRSDIGFCSNGAIDQLTGECLGFTLGIPDNPSGCGEANPCNPATGAKFQTETDLPASSQGLGFNRYYNSQGQYRDSKSLGPNWRHNYGGRLLMPAEETAP